MTNDHQNKATQIAFNFGPVNGNVLQQHIHTPPPSQSAESYDQDSDSAEPQDKSETREKTESSEPGNRLTIAQAVILFSALLGEPLEQGYGKHKTQLAELISQVTGYKAGSIRQKIMEIGKMDVYPHHIQQDAETVAKMIQPYNSQVASDIRITYLDE
ncbi:MAG: hypothetical protein J6Q22_13815 [Prevotella sp.]|nr:hypothetical protein [Prevotella sp.]